MWIALPCHYTDGITAHFEGLLPRRSTVLPRLEVVHQWFLQHQVFDTEGLVDLLDMGGAAWTVGQGMTARGLRDALGEDNLATLQQCGEELGRVYDDINSEDLCPICLQRLGDDIVRWPGLCERPNYLHPACLDAARERGFRTCP